MMSKGEQRKDPLLFYKYYSDGLWSSLRFMAVWSGYQVYKKSLDVLVERIIPPIRCDKIYEYILADLQVGDKKKKEYAGQRLSNDKLRKLLTWHLRGEIGGSFVLDMILKSEYNPAN